MEKLTINSTIKDLLYSMQCDEDAAGDACMSSEGTQGCVEANQLQDVRLFIENYIPTTPETTNK